MHLFPQYFSACNKRTLKSPPVPCLDQCCGGTVALMDMAELAALVRYRLNRDPTGAVTATCTKCGRAWAYDQATTQSLTPDELKPLPLPSDCAWAVILIRFNTSETMAQFAFAGERVLVSELHSDAENWTALLVSESQFAPKLKTGSRIGGPNWNGHLVALSELNNGKLTPVPLNGIPYGADFGCFFVPKKDNSTLLECANPFCSNPSCGHVFGLTHSQLEEQISKSSDEERSLGQGSRGYVTLKCEICQTACVADSDTFRNLFKV